MKKNDKHQKESIAEQMDYRKVFVFALLRIVPIAVSFLVTWIIVRIFSQEDAGAYFYVFSLVAVLGALASLGLNQSLVRFLGASGITGRSNEIVSKSLLWIGISCFLLVSSLLVLSAYIANTILSKPELQPLINAQALAVVGLVFSALFAHAFQGINRGVLTLIFLGLAANTFFVIALFTFNYFFHETLNVVVASWMYSISTIFSAILGAYIWFSKNDTSFNLDTIKDLELFSSALPLCVAQIVNLIIKNGSLIIAGIYVSTKDIALLSVSLRLAECLFLIYVALALIVSPKYANLWAQGEKERLFKLSSDNIKFLFLVALMGACIMYFLGEFLLGLFGEQYKSALTLLFILCIGQVIYISTATGITVLNMTGNEKDMMYCSIISGSISLPLSFFLISNYSVQGAAIASAASMSILGGMSLVFSRYRFSRWLF